MKNKWTVKHNDSERVCVLYFYLHLHIYSKIMILLYVLLLSVLALGGVNPPPPHHLNVMFDFLNPSGGTEEDRSNL